MGDTRQVFIETMKKEGKPLKAGEIAELTGIDSKEVSRVIKELKSEGKITSPKRCYYSASE